MIFMRVLITENGGLWNEISMLMGQGISTLVAGDFNCIDSPQEKQRGRVFVDGVNSREFWGFIEENG